MTKSMIRAAMEQAESLTLAAYQRAAAEGVLPAGAPERANVEIPKDPKNGDYACSFALTAAKALKSSPRAVAQAVCERMDLGGSWFDRVEIAGPGFLNFFLGQGWLGGVLAAVEADGAGYGRCDQGRGERVMVEFVSANPTGPMHMGNARGGVLGDSLSSILSWAGYDVWREFYVNDAGNQIHKFAVSLDARYRQQILGADAVELPADGYQGEDITELARLFREKEGDGLLEKPEEERLDALAAFGLSVNLPRMREDLEKYRIRYDRWFLESSLHESGAVERAAADLTEKGYTYEKDGALWLDTTRLLKEKYLREGKSREQVDKLDLKDDVLRRANGFYTYFAADIAYHRGKLEERGFQRAINVWGADHHGHVARLQAALDALGLDGSHRLVIVLMQLVNLLQDGQPVRMSKRTGKAIALHDLLDEIGVDAARFYFNNRSAGTTLDFDLDLAVREDSENPVYYVQYAHARICTLVGRLAEEGHPVPAAADVDPACFTAEEEKALIKTLSRLPEEVRAVSEDLDPFHINRWLLDLAGDFHRFYNACHIREEREAVMLARLKLADCTRQALAVGLGLIGVTAPAKM